MHTNAKLINKINEGVSTARNIGIKKAIGKWIAFIDADDYLDPKSFSQLIEICELTNSDVITFQYRNINPNIESTLSKINIENILVSTESIDGISFIIRTNGLTWRHGCWINIYNKDFIIDNNIYFPTDIYYSEDCIFVWKVFLVATRIHIISNVLYNYIHVDNSCTNNNSTHLKKLTQSTIPLIKEFRLLRTKDNS